MYISVDNLAAITKLVVRAIGSDRKIECIKELRVCTGLGLKESKDLVEAACPQADPVVAAAIRIVRDGEGT